MAIKLFDEVVRELKEASVENWDIGDCVPVMKPQDTQSGGSGGEGQETKIPGEEGTENPPHPDFPQGGSEGGKPDPNAQDPNDSTGGSDGKEGEKGKGKSGDEASDVNKPGEWMDDHSKIEKGDGTAKSVVNAAYKDVESDYRKMASKGVGEGIGSLQEKIKKFTKADFDMSKVLARIGTFKRKLSEYWKKRDTYFAASFNPVTQQTDIVSQGGMKEKKKEKKSAMLIFAVDTSGSITQEDYKVVFGYLQDIAKKFEKKEHGIDGEVMLISWDTAVHGPMKEFKAVKGVKPGKDLTDEQREKMKLKGGGGTNIQNLFDWLDENLVKEIDGQEYFVFSDKMPAMTGKEPEDDITYTSTTKLKKAPDNYQELSWKEGDFNVPAGQINLKEGGFSNVPFLIIYTDGWFSPPNVSSSKLFGGNMGNVLYIVTDREGIKNIRPKNYIYHNLRGD